MKIIATFLTALMLYICANAQDVQFGAMRLNHWTTTTEGAVSNDIANIALAAVQTNIAASSFTNGIVDVVAGAGATVSKTTNSTGITVTVTPDKQTNSATTQFGTGVFTSIAVSAAGLAITGGSGAGGLSATISAPGLVRTNLMNNSGVFTSSGTNSIQGMVSLFGYASTNSVQPKTLGTNIAYPNGQKFFDTTFSPSFYPIFYGNGNYLADTLHLYYPSGNNTLVDNAGVIYFLGGAVFSDSAGNANLNSLAGAVTNQIKGYISSQLLIPSNVNTNLLIAGHSQEDVNTNTITIRDASSNDVNLVYSILSNNAGTITWSNAQSGYTILYVPSVPTNTFFIRDNSGNSLFLTTNSPQNTWKYNFYTSGTLPTGDWGRISDFSTNGNSASYTITNLPANSIANGITSNQIVSINAGQIQGSLPASDLNGVTITNITINGLTLMLTNTAPSDAVTPKVWFVITNSANTYKVPGYQ